MGCLEQPWHESFKMQYTNSFPHSVRAFISAEKAENASQLDALALTSVEAAVPRATENSPSALKGGNHHMLASSH